MKRLVIVGGGILGLASAVKARQANLAEQIVVLEKESKVGAHQSSHNSGVLHCGLYYRLGSLKARLAVRGIREMVAFCEEEGVPHEVCGKIVLAVNEEEAARLKDLHERGQANGLKGLRWLDGKEIEAFEPHARGTAALHVPEEGIVDYQAVMERMRTRLEAGGDEVRTGRRVKGIRPVDGRQLVETVRGEVAADYVLNCAGLQCDRVATAAGVPLDSRIIPFRGDYWKLSGEGERLVRNLIYPVPDPRLPFLGVHYTRMIGGGVEAGPNAVLAFDREGYGRLDFSFRDTASTLTFPGLYRFLKKYPGTTWNELRNSFSKAVFLKNLQRLIPEIGMDDLAPVGGSGVRAQAIHRDGSLLMDFALKQVSGQMHVLNAPSPGATASLAIGGHLVAEIARGLGKPIPGAFE